MNLLKRILPLGFCVFTMVGLQAQEAFVTTGKTTVTNGGSVSHSVGQLVYATYSSSTGTITQGVQHPYEIMTITDIDDQLGLELRYKVFPNPTMDVLILEVKSINNEDLLFQLIDLNGKILIQKKIAEQINQIHMENYVQAIYILRVIENNKEVKSFKIIKH